VGHWGTPWPGLGAVRRMVIFCQHLCFGSRPLLELGLFGCVGACHAIGRNIDDSGVALVDDSIRKEGVRQ
jgi:hypothetical protein